MKASNVLKLSRWIERNRSQIMGQNKTQKALAEWATKDLSFRVPPSALSDVLKEHGIQTRKRSEHAIKIEQLTEERDSYRQWLLRCIDTVAVQDWLLEEMEKDFVNDEEISKAIHVKLAKTAVR